MIKSITALAILIGISFSAMSQNIVTDRPDQTESSSTVPKNSLQIEAGSLIGNGETRLERQYVAPTTLLRYGLTKGIELRLGQQVEFSDNKFRSKFGMSDLELGAKIQILRKENIKTEIAFLSHIVFPSGSDTLSNGKVGTVNKLAISQAISDNYGLGCNLGYNYFGEGTGIFNYSFVNGIGITDKVGTYFEVYGELLELNDFVANFDAGLTYLLKPNFQLDVSFGLGLNQKMNYLALGFSWNIATKK